jgi:hypothetical protein
MKVPCLLFIFVSACSTGPRLPELVVPPRRLAVLGASIMLLNEEGWLLAENGPHIRETRLYWKRLARFR